MINVIFPKFIKVWSIWFQDQYIYLYDYNAIIWNSLLFYFFVSLYFFLLFQVETYNWPIINTIFE